MAKLKKDTEGKNIVEKQLTLKINVFHLQQEKE